MCPYFYRLSVAVLTFIIGFGVTSLRNTFYPPTLNIGGETPLLTELMAVEEDWHQASVRHERPILERVLADEFTNIDQCSQQTDKVQFIRMTMGEYIRGAAYSFDNPQVQSSTPDKVTIEIGKTWMAPGYGNYHFRDIDTFIRRDGRWQVASSDTATLSSAACR